MSEAVGAFSRAIELPRVPARARSLIRRDARRSLQLVLAVIWLLDGILQLQSFFFTRAFGAQMIPMTAAGNPAFIARPITWSGAVIAHHAVLADAAFALIQIAIALGIAWRPTVRAALAVSVVWSLGVWWIGEGLGGIVSGAADSTNGAPGAVLIYALLAVLLWPRERTGGDGSFPAAVAVGARTATLLWALLWGSLAYFAVAGSSSSAQGLHDLIGAEAAGEPGWLAWLDRNTADLAAGRGLPVSVVLAVLFVVVALGTFLTPRLANATLILGAALALAVWVVGENFGALFTRSATDVNSGPLLIVLCVAFWRPSLQSGVPSSPGAKSATNGG